MIIVQKPSITTTDYYEGTVYVRAKFDKSLLNPSSTLAKSYTKEFCTLVSTIIQNGIVFFQ